MKLLMLMGGPNKSESNNPYPLYLTEIKGKILLESVLEKYSYLNFSESIFCIKQEDIDSFNLDSIIKSIMPQSKIVVLTGNTKGAVCTALLATEFIDNEEELLVASADDFINAPLTQYVDIYRKEKADVGLVYFSSVHPRYSFIKRDENNKPCEFTEKRPVSRQALASFFYFKKGKDFVEGAHNVIRKDCTINNSFYISQILNEMILMQKVISTQNVKNEDFHSFKTERQLASLISKMAAEKEL